MRYATRMMFAVLLFAALASWLPAQELIEQMDYSGFSPGVRKALIDIDQLVDVGKFNDALVALKQIGPQEKNQERSFDLLIKDATINLYTGRVGYARFLLNNKILQVKPYVPALIAAARTYIYYPPYDREEGKKRLNAVLAAEPKNWTALIEFGYCDFYLGDLSAAEKSFKQARKFGPQAIRAYYGLADVEFRKGKFSEAIEVLQDALKLQPENTETMYKIGSIYMGSSLSGRDDSSVSWFDRALEYGPTQPKYFAAVMMAYFVRFTATSALSYFKKLEAMAPNSSYTKWADGVYLELTGRVGAALQRYEEAVVADGRNWFAHFSRANIYSGRGNIEYCKWARSAGYRLSAHVDFGKAKEAYQVIKANAPTFPFVRVAEDWYQQLLEQPEVSSWEDPAFKDKLQRLKRYGEALKAGMY